MDQIFALICIFMMFLMTFGVVLLYTSVTSVKKIEETLIIGITSVLISALLWIFIGYDLNLDFAVNLDFSKFLDTKYTMNNLLEMFFFLYAVTMIFGSVLERANFLYLMVYISMWMFVVYLPFSNYLWGSSGFFSNLQNYLPSKDFSGGLVVHTSAGIASLVLCVKLAKRKEIPDQEKWQKPLMLLSTVLIIVGWLCFNMAPSKTFNNQAIQILLNTFIFVILGAFSSFIAQYTIDGKFSYSSLLNGSITALVASTTSVGYVGILSSSIIAILVPFSCPFIIEFLSKRYDFDDSVDSFAMNGVGGFLGSLLAGLLMDNGTNLVNQTFASVIIAIWSLVGAILIKKLLDKFMKLER